MSASSLTVFLSYSHDSEEHKLWVKGLAERLTGDGVHVLLDYWDVPGGGDLPRFMHLLKSADKIIAVCTEKYVKKAETAKGGVGYESQILTSRMMEDLAAADVIPIVRSSGAEAPFVPTSLGSKLFFDFRTAADFEVSYKELLIDLYEQRSSLRPPRGRNPFEKSEERHGEPLKGFSASTQGFESSESVEASRGGDYVSLGLSDTVEFDFSDNDGHYICGEDNFAFVTKWTRAGNGSIHVYKNPPSVEAVALAAGATTFDNIPKLESLKFNSSARTPQVGEFVVMRNNAGYYLAARIDEVDSRGHGRSADRLVFSYRISQSNPPVFS
ncbi:toll/interleukin-1 receptor domain-containing protein [Pseudomonas protegens]|uniref:toll/interleukin-1 receptor domain-containing protein n=1 Tax=Pseudomonas protegens TaxID=380021 RepID=UPI002264B32A|nr:toll/interleukin-1 receptor domain-containing protein [Pseudomonas protegens]